MSAQQLYDVIIIGAGPAGLSAGLYAGRATLNTLILEGDAVGGQVTTTSVVYNYPAVEQVDGTQLMNQLQKQVTDFGVEIKHDQATFFDLTSEIKTVTGRSGQTYQARSVIIATGANPKQVGFPGENEFRGRGIAYCSTCDGELFTGLQVFVVGGGYAAAEEADYLSRFAKHVTVLVRGDHFTCPPLTAARALNNPKVSVEYNTEVKAVTGDDYLTTATLVNNQTGRETVYHVDDGDTTFGMFIYVGTQPATVAFKDVITLDEQGYIKTDDNGQTNLAGVYAAGDVIAKNLRQIVTAAADGAVAASAAERYVTQQKEQQGVPIQSQSIKQPQATVGQTSQLADDAEVTSHQGDWLSPEINQQLTPILGRLKQPVTLQVLTDQSDLSQQLVSFATEFASLDEHLKVTQQPATTEVSYLPQLRLLNAKGQDTGVHYAGIPTGHELNSLVLGIYNLAGPGQPISPAMVERIKKLPATNIRIGVALTCHFCPDVVAACQRMAALNPQITATMIDLQHFPELRQEKKIMSVPATMINDAPVIFGSQSLEELVAAVEKLLVK